MRRKSIALLCIALSIIILQINVKLSNAQEKINLFDEILSQTSSRAVEYGLKTCFSTGENGEEICNYLIKSLGLNNKSIKLTLSKNVNSYCINFSGNNMEGYIESLKNCDSNNNITINVSRISNKNGLVSLKNKVSSSIGYRGKNIKYYQYLKAKVLENSSGVKIKDDYNLNKRIINILKSHGTKNIETVAINNGLSTVAYTKEYDAKITNNKLIDFNYAVCDYSSGRYIIIGTPEIITTY
ncbi:YwmB family TATA-box binding protein [Clostridium psychrophilum]|uniref:YwmB family TATA-box binding protein n=1 Tax=Clostridium psychrophilum TaxID=132926 RepID=UPI001C0DF87F|nr:YwmB family TATA-box binding protein [Clostridium psychrophilum]MBU3179850.1 YwmB family TATA-box binding protein [Clostridium psychrophilum]